MKSALIGYTGFVGGFLESRMPFTHRFRRSDIELIEGESFDLVVCAGMPAAKWIANMEPEHDSENTDRLIHSIAGIQARTFVLISTIDIYQNDVRCTEETTPCPQHVYGKNRLRLEQFVKSTFLNHHIIRLPALFGHGLRKNALYDLINENQIEKINPESAFQWYDLEWLPGHIALCQKHGIREANLFTEPVSMRVIQQNMFPALKLNPSAPLACYDHKTSLAELHDGAHGTNGYCASADEVLNAMKHYVFAG